MRIQSVKIELRGEEAGLGDREKEKAEDILEETKSYFHIYTTEVTSL